MTVIVVKPASSGLRGLLSRWLIEVDAGVFVGGISATVRDEVWRMVHARAKSALLMYVDRAREQGFQIVTFGDNARRVAEFDGLSLVERARRTLRGGLDGHS